MVLVGLADKNPESWVPFFSDEHQPAISKWLATWPADLGTRRAFLHAELGRQTDLASGKYCETFHPEHLVSRMLGERSSVWAALFRYAPARITESCLSLWPKEHRAQLPRLAQTFSAHPNLCETLFQIFEQNLARHWQLAAAHGEPWRSLAHLSFDSWNRFLVDWGYEELASALHAMPETMQNLIYDRLSDSERSKLSMLRQKARLQADLRSRQAQGHVLSLDLKPGKHGNLFHQLGLRVWVKLFTPTETALAKLFSSKLEKTQVQDYETLVDQTLKNNVPRTVHYYQNELRERFAEFFL
jgi:hypothetical protein